VGGGVITGILRLSATYHLPLLAANDEARAQGEKNVCIEINGKPFARRALRGRDRCLPDLQTRFADLSSDARNALIPLLDETGCLPYIAETGSFPRGGSTVSSER